MNIEFKYKVMVYIKINFKKSHIIPLSFGELNNISFELFGESS